MVAGVSLMSRLNVSCKTQRSRENSFKVSIGVAGDGDRESAEGNEHVEISRVLAAIDE